MPIVHHGIGRSTIVVKPDDELFKGLPSIFLSGRYHSWILGVPKENSEIDVTAIDIDGNIMGLSHRKHNLKGVQFHPESILTQHGFQILRNWVDLI